MVASRNLRCSVFTSRNRLSALSSTTRNIFGDGGIETTCGLHRMSGTEEYAKNGEIPASSRFISEGRVRNCSQPMTAQTIYNTAMECLTTGHRSKSHHMQILTRGTQLKVRRQVPNSQNPSSHSSPLRSKKFRSQKPKRRRTMRQIVSFDRAVVGCGSNGRGVCD